VTAKVGRISDVTSVGGGFVVNEKTKTAGENMFYKGVDKRTVHVARLSKTASGTDATQVEKDTDPTHPHYPFKSGDTLLALSNRHNVGVSMRIMTRIAH
jgi:LysM repeat protein